MISIVVSSYKENLFKRFQESVKQTIGDIPYEIIQVHNPGVMGICQAYNEGARKAQFTYLIFAHEDIAFHTESWGLIIKNVFEQESEIGLIGCAGGCYKSYMQTGWANSSASFVSSYMIGTHYGLSHLSKVYKGKGRSLKLDQGKDIPKEFRETAIVNEEVLMLDGMFLATRKSIHDAIPFDQNTFEGFHCYDLDYSFQINKFHKVVVNHNILVEHFSPGVFDLKWLQEMEKFNRKWKKYLPYSLYDYPDAQKREAEFKCIESILRIYKHNKLPILKAFKPLLHIGYIKRIGIGNWLMLLCKIFKKTLFSIPVRSNYSS